MSRVRTVHWSQEGQIGPLNHVNKNTHLTPPEFFIGLPSGGSEGAKMAKTLQK